MILVDTSVWIDHFRRGNDRLTELLTSTEVACHPMVIGELACGHLRQRQAILSLLSALPALSRVTDDEVRFFIEENRLFGRGLGLIDAHLLASCRIADTKLWTLDRILRKAADELLQ